MTYRADERELAEVIAELAAIAVQTPVPGMPGDTWADLLFDDGGLSDVAEPSQALLHALAARHTGLIAHFNQLGLRARRTWLEETLGIPRVEALPDRVVAVAVPEQDAAPVVIAKGTELRGSRTSAGTDRIYTADDALTVLGAGLRGVRGLRAETARDHLADWDDPAEPFVPFPTAAPAPHHVDLFTDLIRFTGGQLIVELTFPDGTLSALSSVIWRYSTPDGLRPATSATVGGGMVTLVLDGECGPTEIDGELRTFLRGALPDGPFPAGALDFQCSSVGVRAKRGAAQSIAPDIGAVNDGLVDVTKEFQPFGAAPKRGDSFYLGSDEAFGKPLQQLTVKFDMLDAGGNSLEPVNYFAPQTKYASTMLRFQDDLGSDAELYGDYWSVFEITEPSPSLWWQQRLDGRWRTFFFGDPTLGLAGQPAQPPDVVAAGDWSSEPTEVAGIRGHFIRLFLAEGDFGWSKYQEDVANFAAEAAALGGTPDASDLIPPVPPTVSQVTITYTTKQRPVTEIRATNGMARRTLSASDIRPFREPFARTASPVGVLAIGVDLPADRLGSTLSAFLQIEPGDACPALGASHTVEWEYWRTDGAWRPLAVVDATSGLRQDGLVRFAAPADWELGCPDTSAAHGRWVRALVAAPDQIGAIQALHLDAVIATRADSPGPEAADRAPLAAEALKGPRTRIAGVKKIFNPAAGLPGRRAEDDERYLERASDVTRHRDRAVQAWDYEQLVRAEFNSQVAAVRCLPHRDASGARAPGFVTLVVVPASEQLRPRPSVTLAERIRSALRPRMPAHAELVVACPEYVSVSVDAEIVLAPGVPAADAAQTLRRGIDRELLHPLAAGGAPQFGRALYRSSVVSFLERRAEVDFVRGLELRGAPGAAPQERIDVPELIGLIASSGEHELALQEQL